MKWSKYNFLFKSEKHGHLLYNSYSNSFIKLDENIYDDILKIKENPDNFDFSKKPMLFIQLKISKVLLEKDQNPILDMQQSFNIEKYSNPIPSFTIAPTRACNFKCSYCYEENRPNIFMNKQTQNSLIDFMVKNSNNNLAAIGWYGGEPLLAFDTIKYISDSLKKHNIRFSSYIVTNGFLLDKDKADLFKRLNINKIQITLDGLPNTHNKKRPHVSGLPSFEKIINNIKYLIKVWNGKLLIRVNIDKSNKDEFPELYRYLKNEINYKKLKIYCSEVRDYNACSSSNSCILNKKDFSDFIIEMYSKHKIVAGDVYPVVSRTCSANRLNSYLIDPEGNIYKCWHDMGKKEKLVGNINKNFDYNSDIINKYMCGVNVFDDNNCKECFFLPICYGGCPEVRYLNKYSNKDLNPCLTIKNDLKSFLEMHYETKLSE